MPTWVSLVEVTDAEFQNLQELTSIWGDIRLEAEEINAEIEITETYALLGRYDFLLVFEAPDRDAVFQLSLAVERQGLDMTTMEGVPIDHFADLVADQYAVLSYFREVLEYSRGNRQVVCRIGAFCLTVAGLRMVCRPVV